MSSVNLSEVEHSAVIALNKFSRESGIGRVTLWRWQKLGWIKFTNIAGRLYLTSENLLEFKRRAAAGEFSSYHPVPPPPAREVAA